MSDKLEKIEPAGALQSTTEQDSLFGELSTSGGFLGRVMLMGNMSKLVVSAKVKAGNYALIEGSGDDFVDLGDSVDCLVMGWRAKALDISGDDVINCHDQSSPVFKEIQAKADLKDSGCMFGAEFLIYLKQTNTYAGFFMSSKTARRESPELRKYVGEAATLASRLIDPPKTKHAWWGPQVRACSTPFEVPGEAGRIEETRKFLNPPIETRKLADAPKETTRER